MVYNEIARLVAVFLLPLGWEDNCGFSALVFARFIGCVVDYGYLRH